MSPAGGVDLRPTPRGLTYQVCLMYIGAMRTALPRPRGRARPATDPETTARLFHALSDGTRLAVLGMLAGGERCVCDLQGALDAAQSRLSFHLKVLKDAGLVTDRKEGRWSYYTLNAERVADAQAYLGLLTVPGAAESPTLVPLRRADAASRPAVRSARQATRGDGCCG